MPATQTLGQSYFQEFAAADGALDQAETSAIGLTVIAGGMTFSDVVRVYETSALDPRRQGVQVLRLPGVGLILAEEGLDANRPTLTHSGIDGCRARASSALLLLLGLPLLAAWRRKRVERRADAQTPCARERRRWAPTQPCAWRLRFQAPCSRRPQPLVQHGSLEPSAFGQ
jgi:hypothetical protein